MDNLLQVKVLGPLLRSAWTWRLARLICLVLLVAMVAWGWHHHQIAGLEVRDPLMYTSITNHLFWVWWIMGIVFIALFLGRSWCAVCPLGWLNGLAARFGFKHEIPSWLGNFIPVTLVLLVLQLLIYFFAIHRYPDYTALLLAFCLLFAIVVGLLFKQRAFCTLLCPAGAVFSLYARLAPFQLRVKDRATCAGCDSQRCISEPVEWSKHQVGSLVVYRRQRLDGCPVGLVPSELADSAECTLCLNCLQNCDKQNVKLGFRSWLADLSGRGLRPSETFFFLVLLGLLTANFSKVYVDLRELIYWLPQNIAVLLGWQDNGFYVLAIIWVAVLMPLLLMMPGYLLFRLGQVKSSLVNSPDTPAGSDAAPSSFWGDLGRLALPFIPLVLAAHAVLALVKINAKAAYLPLTFADTTGIQSYLALNVMKTLTAPGVLFSLDLIKWVIAAVLVGGLLISWRVGYSAGPVSEGDRRAFRLASFVGVTIVFGLYMATVITWLFVR